MAAPSADQVESLLDEVRRDGGRVTAARRAVLTVLVGGGEHLTAESLAARVHQTHPEVHRSTVYRILDDLEQRGMVTHVHLRHGPAVYHLPGRPHHHLVCETCDAVVELPVAALTPFRDELLHDYDFALDTHFAFTGTCSTCRAAQAGAPSPH